MTSWGSVVRIYYSAKVFDAFLFFIPPSFNNLVFFYIIAVMFEVRVDTSFAAAHFLADYHGKCERLHGHNYHVYAHVRGFSLDAGGMLLDFSELKAALKKVCDSLDHRNLNDFSFFEQNPSAERIAVYIYNGIIELIPGLKKSNGEKAYLYAIDVFETDNNRARYLPD